MSTECLIQLTKLGYDATPFNQILKQNAKREMRLRLGKVTVADVLAVQPVTTNLLNCMRASIKMIGVSNLQSFIASMTQFFFSSRRRHTRSLCDWSSDVCSSDLVPNAAGLKFTDVDLYTLGLIHTYSGDRLQLLSGADEVMCHAVLSGAVGAIGTFYNLDRKSVV